jgi:hypothetical protein
MVQNKKEGILLLILKKLKAMETEKYFKQAYSINSASFILHI